ncbi:MAG: hypothetical protein FJX44_07380 [Alphaproteobacteria bacterium]|nr:hypothetical protein [Alphaproteobacteria bacterium]
MRLGWRRFVLVTLGGFAVILALLAVFILLMNPYGNLPRILFSEHAITDINQRFQYPALVRSDRYDSAVIGASDARLLHPDALEKVFGGNFANFAMNAGLAHEQYRLADLFMREVKAPRTLLLALDHVWCDDKADQEIVTFRGFPEWMYDADWRNDLPYMLNAKAVEISGRRLRQALGFAEARFLDGYEVFTPPENEYDAAKAKAKLWGKQGPEARKAQVARYTVSSQRRASWQFPALVWLDEILTRFSGRVVLAYMPAHIAAQPRPGSAMDARREECKARIAEIARRHSAPFIDFNIPSAITSNDDNYWDPLHYRLPIAERIVQDIGQAIATGKDDPNGDFHYLAGPVAATASPTPE